MTQADVTDVLKRFATRLRENGATALYIFGSRARGTERPESDLDLFIDYDRHRKVPDIFELMRVESEMSSVLGVPVTITTRTALHPLMKGEIERQSVRVL
ncbi:MAG: nucleotidyltransferase family protein [Hyphomicrobiales bacterium]